MSLFELFLGFLKVGCFSFGGAYAAIPLIRDIVLSYGWIDDEMLTYMIAVSESTPGPIMVNIATYVGILKGGGLGAAVATFAVVLPAFLIVLVITAALSRASRNRYVQAVLDGIRPCIIGIILETGMVMTVQNMFPGRCKSVDLRSILITLLLSIIYFGQRYITKKNLSPILFICIAAVVGIIGY